MTVIVVVPNKVRCLNYIIFIVIYIKEYVLYCMHINEEESVNKYWECFFIFLVTFVIRNLFIVFLTFILYFCEYNNNNKIL